VLYDLTDQEYKAASRLLNNSSIGTHIRHIIELFLSLLNGYNSGTVNYDNRKRDKRIETDRMFAVELLSFIANEMDKPNIPLLLTGLFAEKDNDEHLINTNFYREVIYNLEHTIHHMALIRVAINEVSSISLEENFGVAASTIQYKINLNSNNYSNNLQAYWSFQ
jgi:hypothetical protein